MKKINVVLYGSQGRMGRLLKKLISKNKKFKLVAQIDRATPSSLELNKLKPHVAIDFSLPEATTRVVRDCIYNKTPLVTGTTGHSPEQKKMLQKLARKVAVFQSPNMSLGVNIFAKLLEMYAQDIPAHTIQIEETHHTKKKDKPSGTALFLRQAVLKGLGAKKVKIKPILSKRVGKVFGIHKVTFISNGDHFTMEHEATKREIFAEGALEVVPWIVNKKSGFYNMNDFLNARARK